MKKWIGTEIRIIIRGEGEDGKGKGLKIYGFLKIGKLANANAANRAKGANFLRISQNSLDLRSSR